VDRFADLLVPAMQVVAERGLIPVVGPLAPGGHFWDTSFLAGLMTLLATDSSLVGVNRIGLAVWDGPASHTGGSPVAPTVPPRPRPYRASGPNRAEATDRLLWYDAIAREHLGASVPIVAVDVWSKPTEVTGEVSDVIASVDELSRGGYPDFCLNLCLGRLTESGETGRAPSPWYAGGRATRAEVADLKRHGRQPRRFSWDGDRARSGRATIESAELNRLPPTIEAPPVPSIIPTIASAQVEPVLAALDQPAEPGSIADADSNVPTLEPVSPIYHYLLVELPDPPPAGWAPATVVGALLPYVARFQPTIGFRLSEAREASRVTIVGPDAELIRVSAETLRTAARQVEAIPAENVQALKRSLGELVNRRSRFVRLVE
jgi:hypothetical protein